MANERDTYSVMNDLTYRLTSALRYATIVDDRMHTSIHRIEPYWNLLDESLDKVTELRIELNGLLTDRKEKEVA